MRRALATKREGSILARHVLLIVYMTVYITDPRYGDKFVEIRKEIFKKEFPASTLVTVSGLATPEMLIEVSSVAVVGSK
jgi:2-iminobutanoate/2-iminopropanoate deaminase